MRKVFAVAVVLALLSLGVVAQSASVNYAVGGWMQQFPSGIIVPSDAPDRHGYPGDTLQLIADGGSIELQNGASVVAKINTLQWTIDYTYAGTPTDPDAWRDLSFVFNANRSITLGDQTGTLKQAGLLEVKWENDYVTFKNGPKTSLFVDGYQVDITALGLARTEGSNFPGGPLAGPWSQPSYDVMAQFDVAAVPEPGTILAALTILGPAGIAFRRRKA